MLNISVRQALLAYLLNVIDFRYILLLSIAGSQKVYAVKYLKAIKYIL